MTATYDSLLAGTTTPGLYVWRGDPARDLGREAEGAGWRVLSLDTRDVASIEQFWDAVAAGWSLPEWFGRNLDALFDALADLTGMPVVLVWDGLGRVSDIDPVLVEAVVDVLRDASGQAAAFAVVVRGEPGVSGLDGLR
jgi:RNAse (barnase) inhibitor barstar